MIGELARHILESTVLAAAVSLLPLLMTKRSAAARHSVWLFWGRDGAFSHWYINFERPMVPTPLGWDYQDDKLDLIVRSDGSVHWKDEDELAEAGARGLVDEAAVRAEAADPELNLMPAFIEAVKAYATLGEICDTLRTVYGTYEEPAF